MRKGYRKYACEDCGQEFIEHWVARNRAARLRCPSCGSSWVNLKTREAKADAAELLDVRKAAEEGNQPDHFRPTTK